MVQPIGSTEVMRNWLCLVISLLGYTAPLRIVVPPSCAKRARPKSVARLCRKAADLKNGIRATNPSQPIDPLWVMRNLVCFVIPLARRTSTPIEGVSSFQNSDGVKCHRWARWVIRFHLGPRACATGLDGPEDADPGKAPGPRYTGCQVRHCKPLIPFSFGYIRFVWFFRLGTAPSVEKSLDAAH